MTIIHQNKLNFKTIFHVYLRSFFFQGSFSVKDRQNIGFAYCMEPVGRELWNAPSDRTAFLLRHTEFFNGNPFMIPLVLGAVANMEDRLRNNCCDCAPGRQGGSMTADDISRFKTAVSQASGSVGDRFFWRTLRPFALAVGLLWSLAFGLWGVVLFLAIFNIPTIALRWYWIYTGYRLGPKVVIALKNRHLDRSVRFMENTGGLIIPFFSMALLYTVETGFKPVSTSFAHGAAGGYGLSWITGGTIILFALSVFLYSRLIPYEGFKFQVSGFRLQVSVLSIVVIITSGIALVFGAFLLLAGIF